MAAIDVLRHDAVTWIWMDRPDRHNAFDERLIADLSDQLEKIRQDETTRVVVLAGRGRSFSAGADLNWMKRLGEASVKENVEDARALGRLFQLLSTMPQPTIARVHGAALGGGMGLVAACDIAVGSTDASFATSEVRLGLIPSAIGPYVVRAIGERHCYRYFQTAERIDAGTAGRLGLLHEVVEPALLDEAVEKFITHCLQCGPRAQRAATELIRAIANRPVDPDLVEDTARRIAMLRATEEAREGQSAFLEKRAPSFAVQRKGR